MKWFLALLISILSFPSVEAFTLLTSPSVKAFTLLTSSTGHTYQRISPIKCTSSSPNSKTIYFGTRISQKSSSSTLHGKKEARNEANEASAKKERVKKEKDDVIEVDGTVIESLPNAMFRCTIDGAAESQPPILATISGKIRKNFVKILVGDKVTIELSPYDLTRGRITYRKR